VSDSEAFRVLLFAFVIFGCSAWYTQNVVRPLRKRIESLERKFGAPEVKI
jgi:hypothetical protein